MLKHTDFVFRIGIFSTLFCCTQFSIADTTIDYNSVDVSALQGQYQRQLNSRTPKKSVVKKVIKRNRVNNQELLQYQRLLEGQQSQARKRQQAARRPTPRPVRRVQRKIQRQAQPRIQRPLVQKARPARVATPAPRRDALFEAASFGNVALIGQLLNRGANVNQANNERETALHMAAAKGHYSAVIYLLNHGANINARTINNWLPIHHATRFRHAQIANYLKQRGSPIYAKTSDGMSAVDMARAVNDRRIMGIFGVR